MIPTEMNGISRPEMKVHPDMLRPEMLRQDLMRQEMMRQQQEMQMRAAAVAQQHQEMHSPRPLDAAALTNHYNTDMRQAAAIHHADLNVVRVPEIVHPYTELRTHPEINTPRQPSPQIPTRVESPVPEEPVLDRADSPVSQALRPTTPEPEPPEVKKPEISDNDVKLMPEIDPAEFVKVECNTQNLQDAMVLVSQARAASEAAINVMKSVFPEAEDSKDYLKVSKTLIDANSLLDETQNTIKDLAQRIGVNLGLGVENINNVEGGDWGVPAEGDWEDEGDAYEPEPDLEDEDEEYVPEKKKKKMREEKEPKTKIKTEKPKKKRGPKPKVKKELEEDEFGEEPKKSHKKRPREYDPIVDAWGDEEFSCTRCKFVTKNKLYFEDHKSATLNYIKCPFCELVVNKRESLGLHVSKVHGMNGLTGYQCDMCPKTFKLRRLYALRWHKETEHEGILYHCLQCPYGSKHPRRLQIHIEAKHEERRYMCDRCNYDTPYKHNLFTHNKMVHSGLVIEKVPKEKNMCDFCGKSVTAKVHTKCVTKHRESLGQAIHCELPGCDFTTYAAFSMKHHMEEHKGETHMCDQCNYTTVHKTNLIVHIKTVHKERKLLQCKLCDFTTKSHQYMWKHKQGHKGIRWNCDLCDFSAGFKGDLNNHMKIVHLGYKVKCELCGYTTPKQAYLKKHMVKTHGMNPGVKMGNPFKTEPMMEPANLTSANLASQLTR